MQEESRFPAKGRNWEEIKAAMEDARSEDLPWYDGRVFKPAYFTGDDVVDVANKAYEMHMCDNLLYSRTSFPSLGRYEDEVVDMLRDLLRAPASAGGGLTTGGTESNVMAIKTARDWARRHRPDVTQPEIVASNTVHMSVDKAAHLLGIKLVKVDVGEDLRADVNAMAQVINSNTILLIGSSPPYVYGEVDPISEFAVLAEENDLWLHVDACLGGFILPFARKLGYSIPDFDFQVPAVTSMSIDLHKYGYAAKGVSALVFRDKGLGDHRGFAVESLAGMYATPNIVGSRSGGAPASAWAVMQYLGEEGYLRSVERILNIRQRFLDGIRAIDGLEILGEPHAYNFGFTSTSFDMYAVADGMADRGWVSSRVTSPRAIFLMVHRAHEPSVDDYLSDLAEVVDAVVAGKIKSRDATDVSAV